MTVLAFGVFVIAVVVMVLVHKRTQTRLAAELLRREEELAELMRRRAQAMDKQAKVFVRKLEVTRRVANRQLDQTHALDRRINEVLNDVRVQRLLNEGKTRRG